jgi:TorA maturation chaperone TorD
MSPGEIDLALCRSALWEALALGFRRPSGETIERLASPGGARALSAAANMLDRAAESDEQIESPSECGGVPQGPRSAPSGRGLASPGGVSGLARLTGAVLALANERTPSLADLQARYDRFFGHTARGRTPPYETEYGEDSPFGAQREMSDLAAFFRAFGIALRPDAHERPDHLACQCEFMLFLARKEAHALEVGESAMLERTRGAARLFLRDHLGRWAPAFGRKLGRESAGEFYGALGELCTLFVTMECRRAGVSAGPELLRLRSTGGLDAPMACGASCAGAAAC